MRIVLSQWAEGKGRLAAGIRSLLHRPSDFSDLSIFASHPAARVGSGATTDAGSVTEKQL